MFDYRERLSLVDLSIIDVRESTDFHQIQSKVSSLIDKQWKSSESQCFRQVDGN